MARKTPADGSASSASGMSQDVPALLGQYSVLAVRPEMLAYEVARLEVVDAYLMRHRRLGQMTGWGWGSYVLFLTALLSMPFAPSGSLICFLSATACSMVDHQRRSFNRFVSADKQLGSALRAALDEATREEGFTLLPLAEQRARLSKALLPLASSSKDHPA